MNDKIEKIFEIAGNNNKYQFFIVTITFFCWFCFELLNVSLSFLEMMPYVTYQLENGTNVTTKLTYEICNEFKYEIVNSTGHSWVTEFNQQCNKVQTGLVGTFVFFGVLIGALIFQVIAEKLGRKYTIIIACSGYILCLIAFQFAFSIYYLWVCSVFIQIFASIGNLGSYLLMNEVTSVSSRSVYGAIVQSAFSVSGTLFIGLYYNLDSWREPFLVAASIALLNLIIFSLFGFESPRYFLNKNDLNEFFVTLSKIAKFNGKGGEYIDLVLFNYDMKIPQSTKVTPIDQAIDSEKTSKNDNLIKDYIQELEKSQEIRDIIEKIKDNSLQLSKKDKHTGNQHSCFSLLTYKSQRLNFLIMCYMWFCTSGIYYGLTINIKNLPGNTYITGIVMFFIEAIAYLLSGNLINIPFLGRKKTIFSFYTISFFVYLLILVLKVENYWLTILSLTARFCVSGVYNVIYTYSTEVYPTVVRSNGLGFNSVCGRIGGMVFPFALEILHESITYLFMALNLLAIVAVMILPETYGKPLTDTLTEEEGVTITSKE